MQITSGSVHYFSVCESNTSKKRNVIIVLATERTALPVEATQRLLPGVECVDDRAL